MVTSSPLLPSARRASRSGPLLSVSVLVIGVGCGDTSSNSPDAAVDQRADRPLPIDFVVYVDAPKTLGESCADGQRCAHGLSCDPSSELCTRPCDDNSECGGRHGCGRGFCRPSCDPRLLLDPCPGTQVCRVHGVDGICVPDCRQGGCPEADWTCDQNSGLCVDPKAGQIGAPCGKDLGNCDGTPNGVCLQIDANRPAMCTIPCSPFAKPCPSALQNAVCTLGKAIAPYCAFLCDPNNPSCPHPDLGCVTVGKDFHVCLPQ